MSSRSSSAATPSPLAGALAISSAAFVSFMSVIVAIMAFAVAGHQSHRTGSAISDSSATALAYASGVTVLVNGYTIMRHGRNKPALAALCSLVFCGLTVLTCVLFTRAW